MKALVGLVVWTVSGAVLAAETPRASEADPRVRYVEYNADQVVEINVRRGVVTRVVLDAEERILKSGTGFPSACDANEKAPEREWCIRADVGTNQVWITPHDGATHNNLEIATTKRDYSLRLKVLPDASHGGKAAEEMYRVIFQYPVATPRALPAILSDTELPPAPDERAELASRLAARPVLRNGQYSMEAIGGGERVAPSLVFDDGRFTYFRFPNNREIPAFFVIAPDGRETRANLHMDGDLVVVHKVAQRFVLRLGASVVAVWNDAYDADGVGTRAGVVVPDVKRVLRKEN